MPKPLARPEYIMRAGDGVPLRAIFQEPVRLFMQLRITHALRSGRRYISAWWADNKTLCIMTMRDSLSLYLCVNYVLNPRLGHNAIAMITPVSDGTIIRLDITPNLGIGGMASNALANALRTALEAEGVISSASVCINTQIEIHISQFLGNVTTDTRIDTNTLLKQLQRAAATFSIRVDRITTSL